MKPWFTCTMLSGRNCWSPSMGTSFSYIAQVSTPSGPPWIRTNTAQELYSDKLKIFKANLISGKSSIYQHRGGYTIPNNVGKQIQYSWALPYYVLFSEKLMMVFFSLHIFHAAEEKCKLEVFYSKKSSYHDQTMTSELAVAIVYLNAEFKKGHFLNLFSVDKSNLCTMATYVESNLLGEVHKNCYSAALPITC